MVTGTKKIQISLPLGQQDNSNALPPGQIPALCPASLLPPSPPPAPAGLTLIGARESHAKDKQDRFFMSRSAITVVLKMHGIFWKEKL